MWTNKPHQVPYLAAYFKFPDKQIRLYYKVGKTTSYHSIPVRRSNQKLKNRNGLYSCCSVVLYLLTFVQVLIVLSIFQATFSDIKIDGKYRCWCSLLRRAQNKLHGYRDVFYKHCFTDNNLVLAMIFFHHFLSIEYREAFALFDSVGDGKIECSESGDVIRSLDFNPSSDDIKKVVSNVDPRGKCCTF